MNIIERINGIPDLECLQGCSEEQIKNAQVALGLTFPEEYVAYVSAFGSIAFYCTEWTGLNIDGYLNVVEATKEEKKYNPNFPAGFFLLEDLNIDGKKFIANEKGEVYFFDYQQLTPCYDSISAYLESCIARSDQ